jgi:hypothetical protein
VLVGVGRNGCVEFEFWEWRWRDVVCVLADVYNVSWTVSWARTSAKEREIDKNVGSSQKSMAIRKIAGVSGRSTFNPHENRKFIENPHQTDELRHRNFLLGNFGFKSNSEEREDEQGDEGLS